MEEARISRVGQVRIYIGKCFRIFKNEKGFKSFISAALIAIIIALVAGKNMFQSFGATQSGAFAFICGCIWIGIFNSIQSVCRERSIIKREYRTGLHISSYIAAHMIYEMVICLAESLIVTIILFILRDCPEQGVFTLPFIELMITFFLVIYSSDILAMIVSCIVKTENSAMTVMPFVLILQLVMSGVIFQLDGAFSKVANLTISKWGVNAMCSISNVLSMKQAPGYLKSTPEYETYYEYSTHNLLQIWGILVMFIVVYGIISVIALKFVDKDKR